MSLFVIGMGTADTSDVERLKALPAFRKASKNMMMSHAAIERAITGFESVEKSAIALVLGSSYGELEITQEFLCTLDQAKIARPLLFQNSLHNATTGFLALQLSLTGPSLSVSNRYFSSECALEAASLLLESETAPFCLVVAVESRVPSLESGLKSTYSPGGTSDGIEISESAAAVFLTKNPAFAERAQAVIDQVNWSQELKGDRQAPGGPFHDSDGLIRLIREIRIPSALGGRLTLSKPDGTQSEILWRPHART